MKLHFNYFEVLITQIGDFMKLRQKFDNKKEFLTLKRWDVFF